MGLGRGLSDRIVEIRAPMDVLFGTMPWIGHPARRLLAERAPWAGLGAVVALVPALWLWGFTVDDALIAVRYARHLAQGSGWRFNVPGPSTDGVTPLSWPLLLLPMARAAPLVVLDRAKTLGLLVWTVTGGALGVAVGQARAAPRWGRVAALGTVALSVPLAAHAVSGMETALAAGLATTAVLVAHRPRSAALLAGLAASLRPEMAPWACVLAIGVEVAGGRRVARGVVGGALALAPFVLCAAVRALVWGRPAPLAVMAKPSDLSHGLAYAGAACVVTLAPIWVLAPMALRRSPVALAIVIAAAAHVAAIAVVGGDWMPYARLMVPVAPSLIYAGVLASAHARPLATGARSVVAVVLGGLLLARGGSEGRRVGADRGALIAAATPALAGARCVAALDVGWVGATTEAEIVDLAGLTDPEIAALPGGHTSKRVDGMFLRSRGADALLLYAPAGLPDDDLERWASALYPRVVEARLVRDPVITRHFAPAAWLPLGGKSAGYVLLRGGR
jgi:hypothetical protein